MRGPRRVQTLAVLLAVPLVHSLPPLLLLMLMLAP